MVYFCLIETGGPTPSHLEVLEAECAQAATSEAKRLMARHASAVMVHVIHGDETVATIPAAIATAGFDGPTDQARASSRRPNNSSCENIVKR